MELDEVGEKCSYREVSYHIISDVCDTIQCNMLVD